MIDSTRLTDPYIYIWDKVLDSKKSKSIIRKFERNIQDAAQGETAGGVMLNVKNSLDIVICHTKKWKKEEILFTELVSAGLNDYRNHLNNNPLTSFTTKEPFTYNYHEYLYDIGYQIQKTQPGKGYTWHADASVANRNCRVITFILYLNNVKEGWTQFYNGDQISPVEGRLIFFPATWTYVHQGYPPKNVKYIMTGWLHSPRETDGKT